MGYPTFSKRVNPKGRDLRSSNKFYKPVLNNSLFNNTSGGNCVWYAYGRFLEVWSNAPSELKKTNPWKGFFNGDGCQMVSSAASKGFKTGLTPKPGAIVCWGYNGSAYGHPGHVAFVEDVKLDKKGKVVSIEVSQSGWSVGDMPNQTLYPGTGQKGTGAYKLGYNNSYFLGFAYNPITFAGSDGVVNGSSSDGTGINFQKTISKLSSSDNFKFIKEKEEEKQQNSFESIGNSLTSSFKKLFSSISNSNNKVINNTISDKLITQFNNLDNVKPANVSKVKSYLSIGDNTVESPYIEIEIDKYKIGSYKGNLDKYPNYISKLNVVKQNGVINQYKIVLIHQVRPGDDANLLDELLSVSNFKHIKLKYGDLNSGMPFRDETVLITNVSMNRDYTNMNISYTLEATSEGTFLKTYTTSFPSVTDKPSNIIRKLLYSGDKVSKILLDAFPGMANRTYVESNNLIPTNDSVVKLKAQYNVNVLDYLNYLVACMSNTSNRNDIIRNSNFYITYDDTELKNIQGAYFKITELVSGINPYNSTNKIYEITVGFNDNIVYDFNIDSTNAWELLYKNSNKTQEYFYTLTNNGDVDKYYSPSVSSSTNFMSEVDKNWWTNMIKFPVTGSITIKGLLIPVMLMDYIKINVEFYGQEHITSGIYAITGQQDILSGSGFKTVLSLVRVTDNA